MFYELLSGILGSKVKIAVLRIIISQPGLTARQIEKQTGKSWGAVKQALDHLQKTGIINNKKGKWCDDLSINTHHILATEISRLFSTEEIFFPSIGGRLYRHAKEHGLAPWSCFLFSPDNIFYLISEGVEVVKTKEKTCLDLLEYLGLRGYFSVNIITSDHFATLWHNHNQPDDFTLLIGESFPFRGIRQAFDFFGIADDPYIDNPTKEVGE